MGGTGGRAGAAGRGCVVPDAGAAPQTAVRPVWAGVRSHGTGNGQPHGGGEGADGARGARGRTARPRAEQRRTAELRERVAAGAVPVRGPAGGGSGPGGPADRRGNAAAGLSRGRLRATL